MAKQDRWLIHTPFTGPSTPIVNERPAAEQQQPAIWATLAPAQILGSPLFTIPLSGLAWFSTVFSQHPPPKMWVSHTATRMEIGYHRTYRPHHTIHPNCLNFNQLEFHPRKQRTALPIHSPPTPPSTQAVNHARSALHGIFSRCPPFEQSRKAQSTQWPGTAIHSPPTPHSTQTVYETRS
ncbi:hypothetical protein HNQ59_003340 [Chitinivorax tropicus]|uniref:Uncharacterized protein n=1 Tax=Chitinivorax tropicus TaxID=714531 RepID=A0A840MTC4_9PROT|nr:hypothetical protein [Chitinivorax tropicus]